MAALVSTDIGVLPEAWVSADAWVRWPGAKGASWRLLRICEVCSSWELPGATHLCAPNKRKRLQDLPPPEPGELRSVP